MSKSKIEQKKISKTERKQVVNTLINSYELLEEKLNSVLKNINNLNSDLNGGIKKRKKEKNQFHTGIKISNL